MGGLGSLSLGLGGPEPGPATSLMRRLLPQAVAWRLALGSMIRRLFDGISVSHEDAHAFIDSAYDELIPEETNSLAEWERQFGLPPSGSIDAVRAAWQANGGQSARYIQDVLQAAGFNVYVHECWSAPSTPRDPRDYTRVPTIGTTQCGEALAQCDEPAAQCNRWLANDPGYIVYSRLTLDPPPNIPSDPARWPFFLYIGGATFGTSASIHSSNRAAFEDLLLRLRPTHLWLVTMITWVSYVLVDGDRVLVDGDPVTVTS